MVRDVSAQPLVAMTEVIHSATPAPARAMSLDGSDVPTTRTERMLQKRIISLHFLLSFSFTPPKPSGPLRYPYV